MTSSSKPSRSRLRPVHIFVFAILLFAAAICYPRSFRFCVGELLKLEAHRRGWQVQIGKMRGSLTTPLEFEDVHLERKSESGRSAQLTAEKIGATFFWKNLLWKHSENFWQELRIERLTGSVEIPEALPPNPKRTESKSEAKPARFALPDALEMRDSSIVVRQNGDFIRFDHVDFHASNVETGAIHIDALAVRQPWLTTKFQDLRGTIALQNSRLVLAGITLEDSLLIQNASADLPELLHGRLKMDFALAAFNGAVRGELRSASRDQHVNFEGSGTFSQISIAKLAAFLNRDADGVIKEGKFTFHGSPRNLAKATFSTRFEATDFRWGTRKWNSLVLGATLVNHRLMIPEFQLQQAHNSLSLKGEMPVPNDRPDWWQDDFNFNIDAKIGNLAELAALLPRGFSPMSGKATIDGAVSGKKLSFNGQLTVTGAELSYGAVPIDKLHAELKLNGNEVQLTSAEFIHGGDFLRGHGVVNILGEKRYWGEMKASIADLSLYSALMPWALQGGLALDWSGDGVAAAHSGAFNAQFKKLSRIGIAGSLPLNLDAEGTYSPASIFLSKFSLSNNETNLAAKVVANPQTLSLQGLRVIHKQETWFQGDAQLPLNIWLAWQNATSASWWNFAAPFKINLSAQNLSLHELLTLTGSDQPVHGQVSGSFTTDGQLAKLDMGGELQLRKIDADIAPVQINGADADLAFQGATVVVKTLSASVDRLSFTTKGLVTLSDVRTPQLALALHLPMFPLIFSPEFHAETEQDLEIDGAPETARVSGSVRIKSLSPVPRTLNVASLLNPDGIALDKPLTPFSFVQIPFKKWQLDCNVTGSAPLQLVNTNGIVTPEIHVVGSPAAPEIRGRVDVSKLAATSGATKLRIDSGSVFFGEAEPLLALNVNGVRGGIGFDGWIFGPLRNKRYVWQSSSEADPTVLDETITPEPAAAKFRSSFSAAPFSLAITRSARQTLTPSASPGTDVPMVWPPQTAPAQ